MMSCILVIEDDNAIRELMYQALALEGFSVSSASNGEQGLEKLRSEEPPKLIFLDLMMPVMDGWQFIQQKGKDEKIASIPVVVVSAFTERATDLKCNGMMKKPIDLDELLTTARRYCG
jgi:CheY-like chemotaxis protein